jgi:hypothetical protein
MRISWSSLRAGLALVLLATTGACTGIRSSSVRTGEAAYAPHQGPVRLTAFYVPPAAQEVGLVQVRGPRPIPELADEFQREVAKLGGDWGVVETIATKFEFVTRTESYSYSCGDSKTPRTCNGTRVVSEEVGTTQLVGRAYRVGGGS